MAKIKKKKQLEENTTVEKDKKKVQEGNPVAKFVPDTVGLSVGVTINLGDFQSLRIDCWISETVEDKNDRQKVLNELTKDIQEHINYVSEKFTED